MERKQNWPEALHAHFDEHAERPFCLGEHDCLLHVCSAIRAMTGVDPAKEFRGRYTTELGFLRLVKERGHESLESLVEALAAHHELKEISPTFAQRGDVVLFDITSEDPSQPTDIAFGIVYHNGVHSVCVGPDGLRRLNTIEARRAWHVGR